jgi:hypothetical protein
MAASFVTGSGSYNIHFSGDFTLTFPFTPAAYDGGAGDTIVIVSLSISGLNTPTGYDRRVRVEINPGGSPTKWLEVWTKQAVGSETSQAINGIGTANDYAVAFFMRGVDDLTGWDQFATNYQMTTTITAPSVDVDHDDSYLINHFFFGSSHSASPSRGTIVYEPSGNITFVGLPIDSGASGTTTLTNSFTQGGSLTMAFPPVATDDDSDGAIDADTPLLTASVSAGQEIEATTEAENLLLVASVSGALASDASVAAETIALTAEFSAQSGAGAAVDAELLSLTASATCGLEVGATLSAPLIALSATVAAESTPPGASIDAVTVQLSGAVSSDLAIAASVAANLPLLTASAAASTPSAGSTAGPVAPDLILSTVTASDQIMVTSQQRDTIQ